MKLLAAALLVAVTALSLLERWLWRNVERALSSASWPS
jgi:hypothetical protein